MMTTRLINKRIAEICEVRPGVSGWFCSSDGGKTGWLFCDTRNEADDFCSKLKEGDSRFGSEIFPAMSLPPNYCEDLNAMRTAEQWMIDRKPVRYFWRYAELLCENFKELGKQGCILSSAEQRAQAFLDVFSIEK